VRQKGPRLADGSIHRRRIVTAALFDDTLVEIIEETEALSSLAI